MDQTTIQKSLQRLRSGDVSSLPGLMQYYRPRLRTMVELRVGGALAGRVDPSDVLQDAFIEATRKASRFLESPDVSLFVWLRGLTRDALCNARRHHVTAQRRSVYREVSLPSDGSAVFANQLMTYSSPTKRLDQDELQRAVTSAIGELKEVDQEVILMRHFEGLSNNEVAEALGINASTATMRHGRALARLKNLLESRLELTEGER